MKGELRPQIETAIDQGVYNDFMAEAAETGVWPQLPTAEPAATANATHHTSHRGGRSYPEGHPDQQPEQYTPLTAEEITRREAVLQSPGHQAAQEIARQATRNALAKVPDSSSTLQAARLRARQERRARP